ncbi:MULTISPECIES: hypothetical protein [Streptomyces]|uniref:DUF3107 domain-containing protein n=2 Tax=Streptomyces TaxID=1883 RepID=A0A2U9NZ03_STRAS|nr:hypothetical protein [Streptomyces actuosus]AWT42567.1 hypothetical protein DMT42_09740 [Streptomyces actuosus]MBM4819774.1 hypothetical protein [Streptomyces actuosus]
MPRYLIVHPRDQKRDDVLVEGENLELFFTAGWAVLSDANGICLAIPSGQGASIQRVDVQEPAPQEE